MNVRKLVAAAATVLLAVGLVGCSVDRSKPDAGKPTIRIAYQTFPSGDLIVKHNRWLEDALAAHPPPAPSGRRIKIRYVTQASSRPPTFVAQRSASLGE